MLGGLELASRSVHKKPWLGFLHSGNPKTFVQPLRSPVKFWTGGRLRLLYSYCCGSSTPDTPWAFWRFTFNRVQGLALLGSNLPTSQRTVPGLLSIEVYHDARPDRKQLITLDRQCVRMNTYSMSITPKAIQDLLDELEASKQSRLRAWKALQRLRSVLSEVGNVAIPAPAQMTFNAEGDILEQALTKSFRIRNEAMKSLCASVRRFRDATIKEECKSDYPHALQALWKALDRAEDLIQN